jgi:hypothetical protein
MEDNFEGGELSTIFIFYFLAFFIVDIFSFFSRRFLLACLTLTFFRPYFLNSQANAFL